MKTHVRRWGNSLAIRIPKDIAEGIGLQPDDEIEIALSGDQIILRPKGTKHYDLDDLLAVITPENQHDAWDMGSVLGNEVW